MSLALYDCEGIRAIENLAYNTYALNSTTLMQRAGQAIVNCLRQQWPTRKKLAIICGGGNNGGDGYIAAQLAATAGYHIELWQVDQQATQIIDPNIKIMPMASLTVAQLNANDVIVDAICGIGSHGTLTAAIQQILQTIAQTKIPILAIDVPTGINANTGALTAKTPITATVTLTMLGLKLGLLTGPAVNYVGKIIIANLGIPPQLYQEISPCATQLNYDALISSINTRRIDMHKGDAGHTLIIGGNQGMSGAVMLAAAGALRVGSGLVSVATHKEHATLINLQRPEIRAHAITTPRALNKLIASADLVVLGPGLGTNAWAQQLWSIAIASKLPMIIDADGLNLLAQYPSKHEQWILTPHAAEAGRLLQSSATIINNNRYLAVTQLQEQYGGIIILKGAGTLLASDDNTVSLSPYGNPGMASGGMGDLLTGIIGGLWAQGMLASQAAKLGICIHSLAADCAARDIGAIGFTASDLLNYLPALINQRIPILRS